MTETADDIGAIHLGDRPLLICDIDEVVLEFVTPFMAFLNSRGHELRPVSFRLTGNIFSLETDSAVDQAEVSTLLEDFYGEQDQWQQAAEAAAETLDDLSSIADIVFLTAMPPRHRSIRRRVLDALAVRGARERNVRATRHFNLHRVGSEQQEEPAGEPSRHGSLQKNISFVPRII